MTRAEIAEHAWIDIKKPFPVGLKEPNSIGLYDMFGNIGELCKKETDKKIIKGGDIESTRIDTGCHGGYNTYYYADYWSEQAAPSNIGFRLVCNEIDIKSLL